MMSVSQHVRTVQDELGSDAPKVIMSRHNEGGTKLSSNF